MLLLRITFVVSLLVSLNTTAIEIKKGDTDHRQYHYQVLNNQLQVLLISDAKADKAAAALNVNVGSYHDPVDRQGLAHFLEHMLFLGTKKYPEADEYQSFVSDNGGSHNAYTSSHNTNYFFDVDNKQLDNALDRFAQFFIAPSFDAFYVERERNAVHSEYQAKIQDDYRRGYDVYRNVINQAHPEAKFSVGSLSTLADRPDDKVRDDLLAFYQQHYSADKMALVVLGNYSIETLQSMVEQRFKAIPLRAKKEKNKSKAVPLFLPKQLPLEVVSQPVKELRQLSMNFALPSIAQYYKEKPLNYISHLLGHEGKGSLLSLLKQQGLAEGLSAGGRDKHDGTAAYYITIQLTQKGVQERERVRSLVFHMIEKIKNKGIQQWRYEEEKLLSRIAFRFRENQQPIQTVRGLASNLFLYQPLDVLRGGYLLEKYDPELITHLLSFLTPENLYTTTVFPEAKTDQVSHYYQAPYAVSPLNASKIKKHIRSLPASLTKRLSLPEKNPFIPENIELYAEEENLLEPLQLRNGELDIWVKQDTSFQVPRVRARFRVFSPSVSGELKGVAQAELYAALLQDRLNEYSYPALLAGASVQVYAHNRGFDIVVQGYHDRLHRLMEVLLAEIEKNEFDPERFEQLKLDTLRHWRNSTKKTPYHQLYNHLAVDLYTAYWSDTAKISALEMLSFDELIAFSKKWRKGAQVKGLFYGNLNQEWLNRWQSSLDQLRLEGDKNIAPVEIARLDSRAAYYDVHSVDHGDQAVMLYVQGRDDSLESQAGMAVLRQLLQSPFYSSLRTEQQLGYIVFLGSLQLKEVPGSVFVVQSPTATVDEIRTAIQTFLAKYEASIPDDISVYKQAVVTQLLEAPANLAASSDNYWRNLLKGNTNFDNRQMLASAVDKLSSQDLKAVYRQAVARTLWVYSQQPKDLGGQARFSPPEDYYRYQ